MGAFDGKYVVAKKPVNSGTLFFTTRGNCSTQLLTTSASFGLSSAAFRVNLAMLVFLQPARSVSASLRVDSILGLENSGVFSHTSNFRSGAQMTRSISIGLT